MNPDTSGQFSYQPAPKSPAYHQAGPYSQTAPVSCIICGYKDHVSVRTFKKDYYPPIAYLSFLLVLFVGILVLLLFRVHHELQLPFCAECWKRYRWAERFETLSLLGFFLSIILGVILLLTVDSLILMAACPLLAVGLIVWAQINKNKNAPKIKKIDRKNIVIAGHSYGDIVFSKTTTATIQTGF